MKKVISSALCLVMLLGLCVPVSALDLGAGDRGAEIEVTYGMTGEYLVTIPYSFDIDTETKKAEVAVSATNVLIPHNSTLNVGIVSDDYVDAWELIDTADSSNILEYVIGTTDGGNDVVSGTTVLSVASGEAPNSTVEQPLYFEIVDDIVKAGNYSDFITFTVAINTGLKLWDSWNWGEGTGNNAQIIQFEDGMTWNEWVNSDYNTLGLQVIGDNIYDSNGELHIECSVFGSFQYAKKTDKMVANSDCIFMGNPI